MADVDRSWQTPRLLRRLTAGLSRQGETLHKIRFVQTSACAVAHRWQDALTVELNHTAN